MDKFSFKNAMPYIGAILIFLILALGYMSPLLEGKRLKQDDIIRYKGMSKEITDFREKTGEEALWTNSMFGGMPAYQISVKYKGNLVQYIDKALRLGLPRPADMVFLYMLGFFILLTVLGVNPWLSLAGAIAYGFSSYFFIILEAGHNSKAHAIAYMAPALAGVILAYRGKYLLGGVLTLLFMALEVQAGHPQITYYLFLLLLVLGFTELFSAIKKKAYTHFLKASGIVIATILLAVLTNITSLWTTWEYGKYTIRGKSELSTEKENRTSGLDKDYATQWSYGISETGTLLIPNFHGGASQGSLSENSESYKDMIRNGVPESQANKLIHSMPTYWGTQPFTSGPVYVGALVVFLFIFGLFYVKGNLKWWLLAGTLLSIMLAWGKNFYPLTEFFLNYFPAYNKFRAVSMTLVIAEVTMPILAFIALNKALKKDNGKTEVLSALKLSFYITGGFLLIFILFPGLFFNFHGPNDAQLKQYYPDWLIQEIVTDRKSILRLDAIRSFIFILIGAIAIWAVISGKLKKNYAFVVIILLVLIDMWSVDKRYLNNEDFVSKSRMEKPFTKTAADQLILKDKSLDYRVLNLTVDPFADASTSYFHKSIGGYHGAKLRRYQELYDRYLKSNFNRDILDMLNTKYIIQPEKKGNPSVIPNPNAYGNAWFVNGWVVAQNADEELDKLGKINPADTAVLDKRFEHYLQDFTPATDSTARIKLIEYQPNHLTYQSNTQKDQLAVFSEIYYPKGWDAFIDGKPAPYFRVDYVLRAMVVPAGKHMIEFKFEPKSYFIGEKISFGSSLLLILIVVGYAGYEIRKRFVRKA